MRIGSLFSGIGGLELGLEWAGVGHTVWQVEQDDYCRQVLARHWPDATRYTDVREVGAHNLEPVDVICGGFPCQDVSNAGKRVGIGGERSGLWSEFARIIRELRPGYVVVENVSALLVRGIDRVLGDLAAAGYDAEWDVLSAADVGAPHLRKRVFLIAYATGDGRREEHANTGGSDARVGAGSESRLGFVCTTVADSRHGSNTQRARASRRQAGEWEPVRSESRSVREDVADTEQCEGGKRLDPQLLRGRSEETEQAGMGCVGSAVIPNTDSGRREQRDAPERVVSVADPFGDVPDPDQQRGLVSPGRGLAAVELPRGDGAARSPRSRDWRATEPDVRGMVDGIPSRLDGTLNGQGMDSVERAPALNEERLRDVWLDIATRVAPQGQGSDEQFARELADTVPDVPYGPALAGGQTRLEAALRVVRRLRQACETLGVVRDASHATATAWLALPAPAQGRAFVAAYGRADWTSEWLGVGRTANGVPARVDRLRALGNAVVPQVAEVVGRRLLEINAQRRGAA